MRQAVKRLFLRGLFVLARWSAWAHSFGLCSRFFSLRSDWMRVCVRRSCARSSFVLAGACVAPRCALPTLKKNARPSEPVAGGSPRRRIAVRAGASRCWPVRAGGWIAGRLTWACSLVGIADRSAGQVDHRPPLGSVLRRRPASKGGPARTRPPARSSPEHQTIDQE